jgi:hypothetical protein
MEFLAIVPEPGKCFGFHETEKKWIEIDCNTWEPVLYLKVPDMNGDGTVDLSDKAMAIVALEWAKKVYQHEEPVNMTPKTEMENDQ